MVGVSTLVLTHNVTPKLCTEYFVRLYSVLTHSVTPKLCTKQCGLKIVHMITSVKP